MIKIGDVLILELKYSEKLERYKCKLVEMKNDTIFIDYPVNLETNKLAFLLDGTQLKANFVAEDGSVYLFESEVLGRLKQNIPMLKLSYPGKDRLIKIQRRQYVRVETSVDIAIHTTNQEFSPFTTVTDDISAGGAAILTSKNQKRLRAGMDIDCWIVLPMQNGEYQYLTLNSKIIRIVAMNEEKDKVSIQFTDISPQTRQLLLRFCFDRQLALKKKGLN